MRLPKFGKKEVEEPNPAFESPMKFLVLDIETSALEAVGAGFILCAVVKTLGNPASKAFRFDEYGGVPAQEHAMLVELWKELQDSDFIIGHNIEKFDIPYLRSRALVLGLKVEPLRAILIDTLKQFRRCGYLSRPNGFGKPSASLFIVSDMLGLGGSKAEAKTSMGPREQWKAAWQSDGSKEALDGIVDHCQRDVVLTEKVFSILWKQDMRVNLRRLN